MKYSQAKHGRVFVIRLEDGEVIHTEIERFASNQSISCAALIIIGGVDTASTLIVGPKEGRAEVIQPMQYVLNDPYEITGTGTIFPNEAGKPILHMHIACGRNNSSVTGCVRKGVKAWHILEIILIELLECTATRVFDSQTGFELLQPCNQDIFTCKN